MKSNRVGAAVFKATCLRILDDVHDLGRSVTVTKKGIPVAQVVPFPSPKPKNIFGALKGKVLIRGNLVNPVFPASEWKR